MNRIALVSCVKTKLPYRAAAQDLYDSQLFKGMRTYAKRNAKCWFILSAKYGLLRPTQRVAPYEQSLLTMRKADRLSWADKVQTQLIKVLIPRSEVLILAGARYRESLVPFLVERGFRVSVPMENMSFGLQLRWLNEHNQ